ncbi:hypothetical protein HOY80DRAFT_908249, partial [Tuber brumale]
MGDLTVGQVSGIINLWVIIVQFTLPLAFVLILVAFLENENSAVTWSVVGRTLQASMWPSILSADSAATRGVRKRVIYITTLSTIALVILAIAGVVTPLGLSEEVAPSYTKSTAFQYLKDISTFGQGTPGRSGYVFSRTCGYGTYIDCPGSFSGLHLFPNQTELYPLERAYIDKNIPQNITDIFKSGTTGSGNLISGPFDVQYRAFSNSKDTDAKNSSNRIPKSQDNVYTIGILETFRSVILDDNFLLVEGLILDTKNGGVGFRNHSAPRNLRYGGTWEENLLWLEPVSQCVDNNLTIDFTVSSDLLLGDLRSTDRGGWVNLAPDQLNFNQTNSQLDPQLWQRTFNGAWMTNKIAAQFFNLTRNVTSLGKSYSFTERQGDLRNDFVASKITIGDINGNWMGGNSTDFEGEEMNFTNANAQCRGYWDDDPSNITNIAIKCSTIFGMAKRADRGEARIYDAGANWSMPIYTCATAIKASMKVVTLTMNGTHTLENLRVDKVVPKNYSSISVMPVWAVENSGMMINEVFPFWGIVDPKYKDVPNATTIQREHLWLLAVNRKPRNSTLSPLSSLALSTVPGQALEKISTLIDFSGQQNFALRTKWQKLSETQEPVALIQNLIWTDLVANSLVGTKSVSSAYGAAEVDEHPTDGMLAVEMYGKRITYDLVFAIPALTILVMWVTSLFIASLMLLASRVSIAVVRELINHTSTGRSVTNVLYPKTCEQSAPTKVWVRDTGGNTIGFVGFRWENGEDGESVNGEVGKVAGQVEEAGSMQGEGTGLRFGEVQQNSALTPVWMVFH